MKEIVVRYEILKASKMPKLKISILKDGEVSKIGYLMPYRKYCFMISPTADGMGNLASSISPLPLRDIIIAISDNCDKYVASDIIHDLVELVLRKFGYAGGIWTSDTINKFIEESIKWIIDDEVMYEKCRSNYIWSEKNVHYCDD